MAVGKSRRAGWALIAIAGVVSAGIVSWEISDLAAEAGSESSDTLPVIGFVPPGDD